MSRHRPSLFWPIVLIGVGLILLLSNMGVIAGNPWPVVLNLWPVLLIVAGLDILLGRRTPAGAIVGALLGLALVAFVLWVLVARPNLPGLNIGSLDLQTVRLEYPLKDIRSADVAIDFAGGENRLYALGDSTQLIDGDLRYYGVLDFRATDSAGQATVRVNTSFSCFLCSFGGEERWDIGLNSRAEYSLNIDLGSGSSDLDLSRLSLSSGEIDMGSGSTDVALPATGRFTLRLQGGSGSLRIQASRDVALRVEIDRGSGGFHAGSRLRLISESSRDNEVYETEGFGSAGSAITLIIDGGSGSITIED